MSDNDDDDTMPRYREPVAEDDTPAAAPAKPTAYNEPWTAGVGWDPEKARDGWITGANGEAMAEYGGCGSHEAVWAPGALDRAIDCVNACAKLGDDPAATLAEVLRALALVVLRADEQGCHANATGGRPAVTVYPVDIDAVRHALALLGGPS